jgi:phosphoribosylaminoimidazole carboxylase/phosphoribosylaminoimidazole-succinocarboxamide synthase
MEGRIVVAEGKTKVVHRLEDMPGSVLITSKNDITKNDDPSATQSMENKAVHATATTCAVLSFLRDAGIPVAFGRQISATEFLAPECKMIPLEVVMRRYAVGSYLKRYPNLGKKKGESPHRFHRLVFELFLKTTGGKIITKDGDVCGVTPTEESTGRPIDDPFISDHDKDVWDLRHPKFPGWDEKSNLACPVFRRNILPESVNVAMIEEITRKTFLVLEGAWSRLGCRLIDFKIEFGIDANGNLLVADVIDNDSWRLRTNDWKELSKQLFRDNAEMGDIANKYALVANLVNRFTIPKQAIVLWRGSDSDKFPEIPALAGVEKVEITISGHKSPVKALDRLETVQADFPEKGVIITVIGMSNGLAPTLSARTCWPVISVPATAKDRPHDVWSSLEAPSKVPLTTVLSPQNAVLASLNILAQTNPIAYIHRQYAIEELDK